MEWKCFWVNLREGNKVSESKMAVSESNMAEFKMAAIIKLSQNKWVRVTIFWVSLREDNRGESKWKGKFKMATIIKLRMNLSEDWFFSESGMRASVFEWVLRGITRCLDQKWQNSRWLPSSSWVRMNEWSFFSANVGNQVRCKCEFFWAWGKTNGWLNPRWQN